LLVVVGENYTACIWLFTTPRRGYVFQRESSQIPIRSATGRCTGPRQRILMYPLQVFHTRVNGAHKQHYEVNFPYPEVAVNKFHVRWHKCQEH